MESEKVKEIKKIATSCVEKNKPHCEYCPKGDESDVVLTCRSLLKELLTLINELEETNERLKHLNNSVSIGADLHAESYKQEITQLENENQQLKDRIAELEKGNKDYYDRLNNLQTYIDNHEEIWKANTKMQLKQFAERLKEKFPKNDFTTFSTNSFINKAIDEILKEFVDCGTL